MIDQPTKQQSLKRLARIEGQIKGIQRMVDDERYCIDVINQINAVKKALEQTALLVMRRHIDSCFTDAIRSKNGKVMVSELMHTIDKFIK